MTSHLPPKKEKLVRHEVLIKESSKKWVAGQKKRTGFSESIITDAAIMAFREGFKDQNI